MKKILLILLLVLFSKTLFAETVIYSAMPWHYNEWVGRTELWQSATKYKAAAGIDVAGHSVIQEKRSEEEAAMLAMHECEEEVFGWVTGKLGKCQIMITTNLEFVTNYDKYGNKTSSHAFEVYKSRQKYFRDLYESLLKESETTKTPVLEFLTARYDKLEKEELAKQKIIEAEEKKKAQEEEIARIKHEKEEAKRLEEEEITRVKRLEEEEIARAKREKEEVIVNKKRLGEEEIARVKRVDEERAAEKKRKKEEKKRIAYEKFKGKKKDMTQAEKLKSIQKKKLANDNKKAEKKEETNIVLESEKDYFDTCKRYGFKVGTTKFGECILKVREFALEQEKINAEKKEEINAKYQKEEQARKGQYEKQQREILERKKQEQREISERQKQQQRVNLEIQQQQERERLAHQRKMQEIQRKQAQRQREVYELEQMQRGLEGMLRGLCIAGGC